MVSCDSNNTSIQLTSWVVRQYDKSLVFLKSEHSSMRPRWSTAYSYHMSLKYNPLFNILFFSRSGLFYDAVCTSNYTDSASEM